MSKQVFFFLLLSFASFVTIESAFQSYRDIEGLKPRAEWFESPAAKRGSLEKADWYNRKHKHQVKSKIY